MPQFQLLPRFQHKRAVAALAEFREWIRREQSVGPNVPSRRMAEAGGVIQHRHTKVFAFHGAVIVAPGCGLAPCVLVRHAAGVHDPPAFLAIHGHRHGHADGKAGVLAVVEAHLAIRRGEVLIEINEPCLTRDAEGDAPLLADETLSRLVHVIAKLHDQRAVRTGLGFHEFAMPDRSDHRDARLAALHVLTAFADHFLKGHLLVPRVAATTVLLRAGEAVILLGKLPRCVADALVAEDDAAMVRMVALPGRLRGQVGLRIGARHRLSRGTIHRPQKRLVRLIDHVGRKRPATRLHLKPARGRLLDGECAISGVHRGGTGEDDGETE